MEDQDVTLLTQGLEALKSLTSLEIDVRHIQTLTNQAVTTLMSSFSHLPKLDHLTLKLGWNKTDDHVPKILADGLKSLPALYSLDLTFQDSSEPNHRKGFEALCGSLENLVSLRKIALELKNTEVTRKAVKALQKAKSVVITWR